MNTDQEIRCAECGESIMPDVSGGVWLHDPQEIGDAAYGLNEDHAARPDLPQDEVAADV